MVADRFVVDSELKEPEEEKSPALGAPAIEAKHELVQLAGEMLGIETALVRTREPALGQRRDAVHAGKQSAHVLSTCLRRALATLLSEVSESCDAVIARPPIGDERRSLFGVIRHERHERIWRSVVEHTHAAPSKTILLPQLDCHADQDLLALLATTAKTRLVAAEIGLVDLDGA